MGCDYLSHHGIKGQRWGVRRYQNADGTLTAAGKRRVDKKTIKIEEKYERYTKNSKEVKDLEKLYESQKKDRFEANRTLSQINYYNDRSRYYRDSSKREIDKISKLDPVLADKLRKKYEPLLDKTFLGDFSLSELKSIQKNPNDLNDKAQKFFDQEFKRKLADRKIKDIEIANMNQQMMLQQQMIQMQMQQEIQQQIQLQIQNQINIQQQQMMFM